MPRGRKAGGRRGRPTLLASTPTAELRRELERRQSMVQELIRQRDALNAELQELEGPSGPAITAAPARRGPGRPRKNPASSIEAKPYGVNKSNLATALRNVLNGKTLSVSELTEAVQKSGYKTKSSNFRTIVNQALIANANLFKKVARGQYTAR
jgi:hypothetical protein